MMVLSSFRARVLVAVLWLTACHKGNPPVPPSAPVRVAAEPNRLSAPALPTAPALLKKQVSRIAPPAVAPPAVASLAVTPPVVTPPGHEDTPWTPDRVRDFVVDIHVATKTHARELRRHEPMSPRIGSCYDSDGMTPLAKAVDVLTFLEKRITGPALPCYLASYFGCTLGEWIANAGVALVGSDFEPFTRSRVTIIEQTPDRIVADMVEAQVEVVFNGELDREQITEEKEAKMSDTSRYTLIRDSAGVWRISDRKVTFDLWECRPR